MTCLFQKKKSVIYFTTELKEGLENLNEKRRVPSRSPYLWKKQVCPRKRISCLQALQYLLNALSRLKQSFSFSWWTVTSLHSKNVLQLSYWKSSVRGTSRHIVYFSYKKKGHSASNRSGCLGTPLTLPQSLYGRGTYADVRTKIFRISGLLNLLTSGAPRAPLKLKSAGSQWTSVMKWYN